MTTKILSLILVLTTLVPLKQDKYKERREEMVRTQIESRGIKDWRVLKAMRTVPRHKFVPEKYVDMAYYDGALPIGNQQTISQPFIVGYMTEMLKPLEEFKVLEIGTGSGYQAAVLAEIVKEVFTIEIVAELGEQSKQRLLELGYKNITLRIGDGYHGWEEEAPFDAIIVTAAAESIPEPLIDQLKEGGRMAIPVGPQSGTQYLNLVSKKGNKVKIESVMAVRFVPFTGPDRGNTP
jgi:protein-L-isoaspartate(D-aspartate) O-methyltransferase